MTHDIVSGSDADRLVELHDDELDDTVELTGNWGSRRRDRGTDRDRDRPVLPRVPRDETDTGWGERPADSDAWLREQRPPHWD